MERQPGLDVVDCRREGSNEISKTARGDDGRLSEHLHEPSAQPIDLGTKAVEHSRLDGLDGRAADHAARLEELDRTQCGRVAVERFK